LEGSRFCVHTTLYKKSSSSCRKLTIQVKLSLSLNQLCWQNWRALKIAHGNRTNPISGKAHVYALTLAMNKGAHTMCFKCFDWQVTVPLCRCMYTRYVWHMCFHIKTLLVVHVYRKQCCFLIYLSINTEILYLKRSCL